MKFLPVKEMPLVEEGDDIGELILDSLERQNIMVEDGDIFVIAQSIISKAEGNVIDLEGIRPSEKAKEISKKIDHSPREVEVILQETEQEIRSDHVFISETKHGFVCANAGVDASNVEEGKVTILPDDPDASAKRIKEKIDKKTKSKVSIIISDSWGRPFRLGAIGFAIGIAGIKPLVDLRGQQDAYGRKLETTIISPPDSLAAAASLEMGEADKEIPVVLIKDAPYEKGEGHISELLRPIEEDMFR